MTWGLNYLIGNNMIIRPELRYDWFSADEGGGNGSGKQCLMAATLSRTDSSTVVVTLSASKNLA